MKYKDWKVGKYYNYKSDHPQFEELWGIVNEIMWEDGPDGHTDGSNLIAAYILDHFTLVPKVQGSEGETTG